MLPGRASTAACASTIACVLAVLALGGCGESSQAKAETTLCEGKTEVLASVEDLARQTKQTVSISSLEGDLDKIKGGIEKITSAQSDLTGARKAQAEKATSELSDELDKLAQELKSISLSQIKPQLTASFEKLVNGYEQALTPIEC
jgi:TolA-binding protein